MRRLLSGSAFIAASPFLMMLSGCNQPTTPAPKNAGQPEAPSDLPTLKVVHPERRTMILKIEQPAHIEGFEVTPIYAKISGYVRAVKVDIDDPVDEKTVLVELDVPEMVAEAERKTAEVGRAEAEVAQAKAGLAIADARVEGAQALYERWQSEYERLKGLAKGNVIDEQTRDETKNQFKAAEATRKERAAQRTLALDDIIVAERKLEVARAEHKRVLALLDYARIRVPYAGVVTARNVHRGILVQPPSGDKKEPLLMVERRDKYRVVADIPESSAAFVSKGVAATISVPALGSRGIILQVQRTAWSLDAKTRTLRAEFDWVAPPKWARSGEYVTSTIVIEHKEVWTLPESALLVKDGQPMCCTVRDGKIVQKPVELGVRQGGRVELLGPQEWNEREEIVATNTGIFSEGQTVKIAP
jgi:HlyD family secretion protein